jgi:hypothetical protein
MGLSINQILAISSLGVVILGITGFYWITKLTLDKVVQSDERNSRTITFITRILLNNKLVTIEQLSEIEEDK